MLFWTGMPSDGSRFLNFCKTPLQVWETSVWTQTSNFHQIWRNSSYSCPLWMAIAWPPEVQLTWVLFPQLSNAKLIFWGFWIVSKLHSRPIDPGPFSTARWLPADDLRHFQCLKSPFQAWLIRVQSGDMKRHSLLSNFWPHSVFFWFSLFFFHC